MSIESTRLKLEPAVPPGMGNAPVRNLLALLDHMGVRYCHWKSNIRLAESLAGAEDLDLLVHRQDAAAFHGALLESGFKIAVSRTGMRHPGVFHAFALDGDNAELVHVHAYFQIVTGDSLVKSYRLALENALLASTRRLHGVPVPAPEAELALFALRVALKHTSPVEILLANRAYRDVSREVMWLRAAADEKVAKELWDAWVPGTGPDLFRDLLEAIAEDSAVVRRIRFGWKLAWRLRSKRRLGWLAGTASRFWRFSVLAVRRVSRRKDLVLQTGGTIIAFVGPKATGKSTLGKALASRLGRHLDVRRVHVGKPPATALSFLPNLMVPLGRSLLPRERSGEYEKPDRRSESRFSLLYVLRMTLLAYDRRALLRRCWRDASSGSIVITDRYPSETVGAIDSSRFDDIALAQCGSPLKRWLMRRERALYAELPRPGLVVRLAAPIEMTIRRDAERIKEDGPDPEAVQRRWQMETETAFSCSPVINIATDQPIDETVNSLVRKVWAAL